MRSEIFSSGIELATLVTSSILLRKSWDVISSDHEDIISYKGEGLSWKLYKESHSDLNIIAFEATFDSSKLSGDLVPSSEKFLHFDFLCTEINQIFSINRTALSLFHKNHQRLDQLKCYEINSSSRLIVTGHGLGGSVASLFTISLLDSVWLGKNRPLCITFGSPLIGDKNLQQAISRSPIWNSCFLDVVSVKDPLPRLFIANHTYMPFGTFLFCSDINSVCFENPDNVLELLIAMDSTRDQNQGFKSANYGNIVKNLNHKTISNDFITVAGNMTRPESNSVLASSISLQLGTLGLTPHMQVEQPQQNIDIITLEGKMIKLEQKFIYQKKVMFSPSKKLNLIKRDMVQLEWYKKGGKNRGIGYYDSYKRNVSILDHDVVKFIKNLTYYWKSMVEEAKIMPQKGSAGFRKSWLYAGTSYRRMVEPLVIAEYYSNGGKDYMTKNRPKHFVLLEEWFWNEMTRARTRYVEAMLTLDFGTLINNMILSRQQTMVYEEMEDYLLSDDENYEDISKYPSFFCVVDDQIRLSSKELNVVEENEENVSNSYFEALVDECIHSPRKGSVMEGNNIKGFGSRVDQAILSRQGSFGSKGRKQNVESILTTDSCFWAHVEEALLLCKELKATEENEETMQKLVKFEKYVYELLENYEV
ncbi:senescence-associated carboxylesterase 101 [Cajanus cajan]|uniref:senescence-associated carboxylesterase 101 n=1 Tax=Cajanus cajan TaxID=3821 RepID=UPI0010FB78B8|nr:senescence-associated carboxylesterase 101 [Cajanus cajan]